MIITLIGIKWLLIMATAVEMASECLNFYGDLKTKGEAKYDFTCVYLYGLAAIVLHMIIIG